MITQFHRFVGLLTLLIALSEGCMRVTPTEPGIPATPACQKCNPALVTKIETGTGGQKPFEPEGAAMIVNDCIERTLVCTGFADAGIEINPPGTRIGDGGTTATLTLRCNAAGTAWIEPITSEVVTAVDCSAIPEPMPCQDCTPEMIILIENDPAGGTPFDSDTTATIDECLVRTIVCKGVGASVDVNGDGAITGVSQGTPDTVKITVTCNGDGTGWMLDGVVVTELSCLSKANCNTCTPTMITKVEMGTMGQKPFTSDMTMSVNGCLQRTFVCEGEDANVEVNGGGIITDVSQGMPGIVTVTAMCNMDGSAWTLTIPPNAPVPVTQLQCAAFDNKCTQCRQDLIVTAPASTGAIPFEMDSTETVNGCSVRTVVCEGLNANVEINVESGAITDELLGTPGIVSMDLVCNADGNAWEYTFMGNPPISITMLQCSVAPACGGCKLELITANGFASDMTVTENMCLKRTLTCQGADATVEVNGGAIASVVGACAAKTAEIVVTCNADGSAWEYMGMPVTALNCETTGAPAPLCQSCAKCLVAKTVVGNGAKPFASEVVADNNGCSEYTLTCMGLNANIEVNGQFVINEDPAGSGTATFAPVCNAAGTGWELAGIPITQLECAAAN